MRRGQTGMPRFRAGLIALVVDGARHLLRVHQGHPVHVGPPGPGGLQELEPAAPSAPRCGSPASTSARSSASSATRTPTVGHDDEDGTTASRSTATRRSKIRPRLFLEGNFYVDLQPGTPGAGELADDAVIPVTQTATPVQLDQVLTALQSDTRGSLQEAVKGFGDALDAEPSAADDAQQDPAVRGLTGGAGARRDARHEPRGAARDRRRSSDALLGRAPHDLSRTVSGFARALTRAGRTSRTCSAAWSRLQHDHGDVAAALGRLLETVRGLAARPPRARPGSRACAPPRRRRGSSRTTSRQA